MQSGLNDEREDAEKEDIQALLELGYEQLDGFRTWVDERLEMGARIAEQDCFNAEFLIDYLANHQRKGISDINEFEMRWFMFSHYIRKAMADEETETRLPESLQRFFGYLRSEHRELVPAWVGGVLDDVGFYMKRRQEYAALNDVDERAWEMGFPRMVRGTGRRPGHALSLAAPRHRRWHGMERCDGLAGSDASCAGK